MAKYDATFWRRVLIHAQPGGLIGTLKRMVENQEQKVTIALTDSLTEHDILESLLEDSKPAVRFHAGLNKVDYLLQTPWRYPPLHWGSRFGRRHEPSLFYGALSNAALFAEAAYYRFLFLEGMSKPFGDRVISQHTVFEANYQTDKGMDLTRAPFTRHLKVLRHKSDYGPCQALGSELRERGLEGIAYLSARTAADEINIALLSPKALRSRKHRRPRHVLCEARRERITFRHGDELFEFARASFLDKGRLPIPA